MRFLTVPQATDWAGAHGFTFEPFGTQARLDSSSFHVRRYAIPEDAGRRVALCRSLWESIVLGRSEALLWITEWGVWPSGEHMPLIRTLRAAHGEPRPLIDAPALHFEANDDDEAFSFFILGALFLWDCYLLAPSGESGVFLSHDEFLRVFARSHDALFGLTRRLDLLELETLQD